MTHPALDVETEKVGIVIQNRVVVSLSVRMAEAVRVCAESGRGLVVATSALSRLTLPMRLAVSGPGSSWAVKGADGVYYNGLNGEVMEWDGEAFLPGGAAHREFVEAKAEGLQLIVSGTVRYPAAEGLAVGGFAEALFRCLTGDAPRGWGLFEPAGIPWDIAEVTKLCRERAPGPSFLVVVGAGIATVEISRTLSGVEETVTLGVGVEALPGMRGIVETAVRYPLVSLTVQACPGRRDVTSVPQYSGLPAPVGLVVGAEGASRARGLGGVTVGNGVWIEVGDGRTPEDWGRFGEILQRLGPEIPGTMFAP
ncbi:DUF6177 family protein [Actinomadura fibrosa]|uniref:DUF6177 family protein n=1 Tax=Actinomadura fibrosa TaxID=111802 RepID=A0ABW2Y2S5_9ACTN|nr:DUF6177 family protein [Actinomadura fibrosa]